MLSQKKIHDLTFIKFEGSQLPDFVQDIVEVKGNAAESTVRLYPKNTPEILINLSKPIRGEMNSKLAVIQDCTIQGCKTGYVDAWHPEKCHFISVRFSTNGSYKFLSMPQESLTDQLYSVDDVVRENSSNLISVLKHEPSVKKRFIRVVKWLKQISKNREKPQKLLSDFIIEQFYQNPRLSVMQLVKKTGYTRKHLVKKFNEQTGLTIKKYQKINRIYRILNEIKIAEKISWPEISNKYGFYDQSHFIKDFKHFTGLTPSEYLRQLPTNNLTS